MITRRMFAKAAAAALTAGLAGCGASGPVSPGELTDAEKRAEDATRDMVAKKSASRKGRSTRR